MFNWLCCKKQNVRKIFPQSTYSWYMKAQNKDGQVKYQERIMRYDPTRDIEQLNAWSHTKIKSKNIADIMQHLQQKGTNFIDQDFPHSYMNISKNTMIEQQIEWKRVGDMVKHAVFMDREGVQLKQLQEYNTNNKAFKNSLLLMARTHPQKLNRVLNHTISSKGLYQFKLFRKGIIYNVVIDDYVPTVNNIQLFSGPIQNKQVYPMLLQKAIAKLTGGYSQIPKNPLQIMEMIYCGAIRRQELENLRNTEQIKEVVENYLKQKGLIIMIAKDQKKVRQYGINNSQIYHVINEHVVRTKNGEQILFEMLSQNKLSAWNGRFSITDPTWQQVDPGVKNKLFKQMHFHHSFCMPVSQFSRIFQQMIVFQDTDTLNKEWLESYSERDYPSFASFILKKNDEVFLRLCSHSSIRQSLIVAKKKSQQDFQYIGGSFSRRAQVLDFSVRLSAGQYIVCIAQDWVLKRQGQYILYLSSSSRSALNIQNAHKSNFLQQICLSHSKQIQSQHSVFYSCIRDIGYSYMKIDTSKNQNVKKVAIKKQVLKDLDWKIMEPHDNMDEIIIGSKTVIVVLKAGSYCSEALNSFPIEAFNISGSR